MNQLHLLSIMGEVVYNKGMESRLERAYQLLGKSNGCQAARDRRKRLLECIYHERYQTRKGLSWRLECVLGKDCSWWDTSFPAFILDLWFVWRAFRLEGHQMAYSWKGERRGFFLRGEGEINPEMVKAIKRAVAELDPRQVEITRQLTPAQRVQQGLSLTNLAHSVVRYRLDKNKQI